MKLKVEVEQLALNAFIGNYQHSIDTKGRLFLPAKQRSYVGEKVYMTRGLDDCIFLFSEDGWNSFVESLNNMPSAKSRVAVRYFSGNAAQSDVDSQGRITIPTTLRKIAGVEKDVTVVGALNRIEIWDTERWESFNTETDSSVVSSLLEEVGF